MDSTKISKGFICPFLGTECVRERCVFWVSRAVVHDKYGEDHEIEIGCLIYGAISHWFSKDINGILLKPMS